MDKTMGVTVVSAAALVAVPILAGLMTRIEASTQLNRLRQEVEILEKLSHLDMRSRIELETFAGMMALVSTRTNSMVQRAIRRETRRPSNLWNLGLVAVSVANIAAVFFLPAGSTWRVVVNFAFWAMIAALYARMIVMWVRWAWGKWQERKRAAAERPNGDVPPLLPVIDG